MANNQSTSEYQKLVKQVADIVWKQMQQELREERERRGKDRK